MMGISTELKTVLRQQYKEGNVVGDPSMHGAAGRMVHHAKKAGGLKYWAQTPVITHSITLALLQKDPMPRGLSEFC